jgi:hypothetical protein
MTTIDTTEAVRATVARVAHYIDAKQWQALRDLFALEVETDYTSLFGGTPLRQSGDALIARWRSVTCARYTMRKARPAVNTGKCSATISSSYAPSSWSSTLRSFASHV